MANNETGVIQPVAEAAALAREHGAVAACGCSAGARPSADRFRRARRRYARRFRRISSAARAGLARSIVRDGVNLPPLHQGRRAGASAARRHRERRGIAGFGAAAAEVAARSGRGGAHGSAARQARGRRHGGDAERGHRRPRGRAPRQHVVHRRCPASRPRRSSSGSTSTAIAVSAGAACSSGKVGASSVLEAMGLGADIARSAVRVSLGPQTSEDDIAAFLAAWEKIAGRAALAA